MKLNVQHIAAILLLMISASFGSEFAHSNQDSIESSHAVQDQHSKPSTPSQSNGCEDLCGLGQCHFGHCSHMNIVDMAISMVVPILIAFHQSDSFTFIANISEQPTRPPRLS